MCVFATAFYLCFPQWTKLVNLDRALQQRWCNRASHTAEAWQSSTALWGESPFSFTLLLKTAPLYVISAFQGPFVAQSAESRRHFLQRVSHFTVSWWCFFASWLLEAALGVTETWSAGQEVQTPSSIPLNGIPGSSSLRIQLRSCSVHVCVCTYNMHNCMCVQYQEEEVGAASLAVPLNRMEILLGC